MKACNYIAMYISIHLAFSVNHLPFLGVKQSMEEEVKIAVLYTYLILMGRHFQ